jgi:hypothetical protein
MWRSIRRLSLSGALFLGACGWSERVGDFTYNCHDGIHPLDGPSCELNLTDHYLLRYGEGSGDNVILAFRFDSTSGSGGVFNFRQEDDNIVSRLGLDDRVLTAQLRSGAIYVAPANPDGFPDLVGPLSEEEFAARYPNAPPWRDVQ